MAKGSTETKKNPRYQKIKFLKDVDADNGGTYEKGHGYLMLFDEAQKFIDNKQAKKIELK